MVDKVLTVEEMALRAIDVIKNYKILDGKIISFHSDDKTIQIHEAEFNLDNLPGKIVEVARTSPVYPWKYQKRYKGYTFYYITDERRPI